MTMFLHLNPKDPEDSYTILDHDKIPWDDLGTALSKQELYVDEERTQMRTVNPEEFMYMHTRWVEEYPRYISRVDAFKHHNTRNYVYLINNRRLHVRYDATFNRGYFGPSEEEINEIIRHSPVLPEQQSVRN